MSGEIFAAADVATTVVGYDTNKCVADFLFVTSVIIVAASTATAAGVDAIAGWLAD